MKTRTLAALALVCLMSGCTVWMKGETPYRGTLVRPTLELSSDRRSLQSCWNMAASRLCTMGVTTWITVTNPTDFDVSAAVTCKYSAGNYSEMKAIPPFRVGAKMQRRALVDHSIDVDVTVGARVSVSCDMVTK